MPLPGDLTGPVQLVLARSLEHLPGRPGTDGPWRYELKWDGFRAAIVCQGRRTRIWSRQGIDLTEKFPDIRAAVERHVKKDCVLDGELLIWSDDRLSFEALQQRLVNGPAKIGALAAAAPAYLMAFDLLAVGTRDLRRYTWAARRASLEDLTGDWTPPLRLSPVTSDREQAQQWMSDYYSAGIEGIVAKTPKPCARRARGCG